MEEILLKYLKKRKHWDEIIIAGFQIDGAICSVDFHTDPSRQYRETENINIWEMLIFLNEKPE